MRALITGANGFVGKHLSSELVANNYHVLDTDRDASPMGKMDITNYREIYYTLDQYKPDVIFHLAGLAYVPSSWDNPEFTFEVNTLGTVNLFKAVKSLGLDPVIQIAGSSEEYGMVYQHECPIDEKQPLRPLSPYAVSKIAMDMLGYQYFKSYGMKIIRTRAFNHEGYGRGPQYMTSTFAKQIVSGASEVYHGNLSAKRDITDVRDMVRAYRLAVEECKPGDVYNIGSGIVYTAGEILDKLIEISGRRVTKIQDPARMRPSDVPLLQCDSTKFREATGWKPEYTIEDTLKESLRYWENMYGKTN